MPRRHRFIADLAGITVATTIPSRVRSQGMATLRVSVLPIEISAAPFYARDRGIFAKHGLDVEIVPVNNGPEAAAAVVGGSLDVGSSGTTAIAIAHERGIPFIFVAPSGAYNAKSPDGGLIVRRSSPLTTASDLIGKTVGVPAIRSLPEVAVRAWLEQNGVRGGGVRYLELPLAEMSAALAAGRIDAAVTLEPALSHDLANGARMAAPVFDAIAPIWIEGGYFCTTTYLRANTGVIKRFADAIAETDAWANQNHPATARILERALKTTAVAGVTRAFFPERLDPAQLQPLIDASAKYGILKATFPARDLIAQI